MFQMMFQVIFQLIPAQALGWVSPAQVDQLLLVPGMIMRSLARIPHDVNPKRALFAPGGLAHISDLTRHLLTKPRAGCPIFRVLCEKWGF